jgi:hypothetical protein
MALSVRSISQHPSPPKICQRPISASKTTRDLLIAAGATMSMALISNTIAPVSMTAEKRNNLLFWRLAPAPASDMGVINETAGR